MKSSNPSNDPSPTIDPLVHRTLDKWLGIDHRESLEGTATRFPDAPSKDGWDAAQNVYRSPVTRIEQFAIRVIRHVLGASDESRSEPGKFWSDYAVDLCGWAVVAAVCVVLVYLVYHGLQLLRLV